MNTERAEEVFLVRMWRQPGDASAWRGSVVEVASGVRFYVIGTRDVADFIEARLAASSERQNDPRHES